MIMDHELLKRQENNEIIDHVEAIREIVSRKCARCNGRMGCMGCLFDSLDLAMIPALLDGILGLMRIVPNERKSQIHAGCMRHHERKATWRKIQENRQPDSRTGE